MKLNTRRDLIGLGIILASVGAYALVAWSVECNRLTPPATATTLSAFAVSMPAPKHLAAVDDAGETKVVWVGDYAKSMFIPTSGPACYVFDSNGILINWDLETGHGKATDRLLQQADRAEPMTVQEAIDFISGCKETKKSLATGLSLPTQEPNLAMRSGTSTSISKRHLANQPRSDPPRPLSV